MNNRRKNFKKQPSSTELRYIKALEKQVELLEERIKLLKDGLGMEEEEVNGYSYVMGDGHNERSKSLKTDIHYSPIGHDAYDGSKPSRGTLHYSHIESTAYECDCGDINITYKVLDEHIKNELKELSSVRCGECNSTVKKVK